MAKKFRSSAAPKGTKLRTGYQDRTQLRTSTEEDDKATRVKALEEMVKLGQMDMVTFEKLRDEIVGGDVKDVHLVKGLDWKLLGRVRRGEDVLADSGKSTQAKNMSDGPQGDPDKNDINIDDEFEKVEAEKIQPLAKDKQEKKGELAAPSALSGRKRNRDEILKELKASRLAAAEMEKQAQQPRLGPKFVKVGEKRERSRIEKDDRGREILITTDEDGNVKRKVKRVKVDEDLPDNRGLLMPDKDAKPLGMEVPEIVAPRILEEQDDDIFADVGADYDPLGGAEDQGEDSDEEGETTEQVAISASRLQADRPIHDGLQADEDRSKMPPPALPKQIEGSKRNYFGDITKPGETDVSGPPLDPLTDPTILAALKKASSINPVFSNHNLSEEEAAKLARRKKMLESHDRDADDMDLGFGSSRFEDGEDAEDKKFKLSVWGQDGGDEGGKGEGKGKRKKGGKKRKGDANSAVDVLKAMERRNAEAE